MSEKEVEWRKCYPSIVLDLRIVCGDSYVITEKDHLEPYFTDSTMKLQFACDIVVKPGTAEEVAGIVDIGNKYDVPIIPRGGGTGVTGGALAVMGGIVVSTERMNGIIEINTVDCYVIAEAGVNTATLCNTLDELGFSLPVQPSSSAQSFIGGNVAENAGAINSCKYGVTGDFVMNLQIVTGNGDLMWTGFNTEKNVAGFNITELFVGSEGVLGIITKVVYRIIRKPSHHLTLLVNFLSLDDACQGVLKLKALDVPCSACELITKEALDLTINYLGTSFFWYKNHVDAQLIIEFEDYSDEVIQRSLEIVYRNLIVYALDDVYVGQTPRERNDIWKLRYSIGAAMTSMGQTYRDIDIAIKPSLIFNYLNYVRGIATTYNVKFVCFGHVLQGNLHTMLIMTDELDKQRFLAAVHEIYDYAICNGGTISGEHGIGLLQKEFLAKQLSTAQLSIMREIKKVFDRNGIINPSKIF